MWLPSNWIPYFEVPTTLIQVPVADPSTGEKFTKLHGSRDMRAVKTDWFCACVYIYISSMLRKLPVILPHELIKWLVEKDLMPEIRAQDTAYYWQHMAQHAEWAKPCKDWRETHPLFLWGDDAVYNKQRDKVVAVALGFVLDDRKSSLHTLFPLFTYKFESRQQCTAS